MIKGYPHTRGVVFLRQDAKGEQRPRLANILAVLASLRLGVRQHFLPILEATHL